MQQLSPGSSTWWRLRWQGHPVSADGSRDRHRRPEGQSAGQGRSGHEVQHGDVWKEAALPWNL